MSMFNFENVQLQLCKFLIVTDRPWSSQYRSRIGKAEKYEISFSFPKIDYFQNKHELINWNHK